MTDFAGYCRVEVADDQLGLTFPMAVLYPTHTPAAAASVGLYTLEVAVEAPLKQGVFPLALISHGTGGSPLVYRTLAHHLARHGFVVGLPEHPFNNRDNNTWAGTAQNLTARPRHLQLAINHLVGHPRFAAALKPDAVALIGHSLGGYTALALAGGIPTSFPGESPDGQARRIPTVADGRVRALVLLAPATPWFLAPGALREVQVPILLLEAEKDEHTPRGHGQIVLNGVPDPGQVEHRVVENAGHFSFLSSFPEARVSPAFPPSQDPPGFDRERFQAELSAEVLAFLVRHV
jgi:predicted dienelactone hydrolase